MKCPTCGGLIVLESGICGEPNRLKCVLCGRDPDKAPPSTGSGRTVNRRAEETHTPLQGANKEKKVEEKIKLCTRCHQPFPATNEYFSKNKAASDGLEYSCKDCKKKAQQGYRDKKTKSRKSTSRDFFPHALKSVKSDPLHKSHNDPITTATPEEIIKALRKGVAAEIVKMIQEAFA